MSEFVEPSDVLRRSAAILHPSQLLAIERELISAIGRNPIDTPAICDILAILVESRKEPVAQDAPARPAVDTLEQLIAQAKFARADLKAGRRPDLSFAAEIFARADADAAIDPFAPVFELSEKDGKLVATIAVKPSTVAYLISATGPRSSAIKVSAEGQKHVLVHPVVEIEPGS